jgi:hypothetical protein
MTSKEIILAEITLCVCSFLLGYAVAMWVGT